MMLTMAGVKDHVETKDKTWLELLFVQANLKGVNWHQRPQ
jgi:hypothetical protein